MSLKDFNRRCVRLTLESLQKQSVEQKIFVASWIGSKKTQLKRSESVTILGRDLLAKKSCPSYEMFSLLTAGLMDVESLSADEIYSIAFKLDARTIQHLQSKAFLEGIRSHSIELLEVWYTIATYETIEYLQHLLYKLGVTVNLSSQAKATIFKLLESYSVGQLWNIAYKAYQKGCEVHIKQGYVETISGDIFLDIFIEKGQRYSEKGWQITSFNRWGYPCRQSEYSAFFFDEILKIGSAGFTSKPSTPLIL